MPKTRGLFNPTWIEARKRCREIVVSGYRRITLDGRDAMMCGFAGLEAQVSAIDDDVQTEFPGMCAWTWPDAERILLAGGDFKSD